MIDTSEQATNLAMKLRKTVSSRRPSAHTELTHMGIARETRHNVIHPGEDWTGGRDGIIMIMIIINVIFITI